MHKIIALWAIPRSTSAAFEHKMKQRNDLDCLHEPFGEASYHGEEPMWSRFSEGGETKSGLSLESVWEDIKARAEKGLIDITRAICEAEGLPFNQGSVTWKAGGDTSVQSWCEGGRFHANPVQSTGLLPPLCAKIQKLIPAPIRPSFEVFGGRSCRKPHLQAAA